MHVYISIFLTREHNNAMKIFHFSCIYLQLCFRMSTKRLPCVMLVLDRLPKEIGTCVPLTHFAETTSLAWLCHISTRIIPHFHMRRRNFKSCRLVFLHTHTHSNRTSCNSAQKCITIIGEEREVPEYSADGTTSLLANHQVTHYPSPSTHPKQKIGKFLTI